MFDYYLTFHVLAGYYITDWFTEHVNRYARSVNGSEVINDAKTVIAVYLFWPIVVPFMLLILHWPLRKKGT